jgi:hypothetical protein
MCANALNRLLPSAKLGYVELRAKTIVAIVQNGGTRTDKGSVACVDGLPDHMKRGGK